MNHTWEWIASEKLRSEPDAQSYELFPQKEEGWKEENNLPAAMTSARTYINDTLSGEGVAYIKENNKIIYRIERSGETEFVFLNLDHSEEAREA